MALTLKEQSERLLPAYSIQNYENLYPDSYWLSTVAETPFIRRQVFHDSTVTPNFRTLTKSQRKNLPINNYEFTVVARPLDRGWKYVDRSDYWYISTRNTARSILNGVNGGPGFNALSDPPSLNASQLSYAKSKAREKVQGVKVNYAQAFAERRQLERLVADTASRIYKTVRFLRRGDVLAATRSLKLVVTSKEKARLDRVLNYKGGVPTERSVASTWLELQYGWKPLLSDIYGTAELLAERMSNREPICSVRVPINKVSQLEYSLSHVMTGATLGKLTERARDRTLISFDYSVNSEQSVLLGKTGISNPLLLAWELVPFSFVVDWFYPVGNYLESFTAFDGLTFRSGFIVQRSERRFVSKISAVTPTYSLFYTDKYELELDCRNYHQKRTRLNSFSDLSAGFPTLKNPFSPSHVASALSLLTTVFGRR